jgi:hypothetical protein
MIHTALTTRFILTLTVSTSLALSSGIAFCQDAAKPKFKGRLPAHYGDIVTEAQRLQIYAVQEKYATQIDALKAQLEVLETKRDKEIDAVLNADQKEKLKKAQKASAERRKATTTINKAVAEVEAAKPAAARNKTKGK